jgi:hypothetical protein
MPVYGLVSFEEAAALERSLARVVERFKGETLRILEIGVHDGRTSRGIKDYLNSLNVTNVENWAIDIGLWAKEKPYPEMRMIWGDSAETFHLVPLNLHWVFVDGCHCINHTMADVGHCAEVVGDEKQKSACRDSLESRAGRSRRNNIFLGPFSAVAAIVIRTAPC